MTTHTPYPNYKPSGFDWLGDIPSHWDTLQLNRMANETKLRNRDMEETTVLSLSYGRIIVKNPDKKGLMPENFSTYQIVNPGNIILRLTDLQNDQTSLRVGLAKNRGIITSAYVCLDPTSQVDSRYLYRLLHSFDEGKHLYGMGSGVRQGLSFKDLRREPFPLPPLDEQRAIAGYLDHKDHQITRFIESRRRMIALLEEKKQAIINQAVTRGLDPTVPMKDSGVEWIGEIPAHWEVGKLKDWLREVDERSESGEEELLSVSHITGVTRRSEKNVTMFQAASYAGSKLCQPGDVVANTMWMWMGAVGISPLAGIVSPSYAVYRPKHNQYLQTEYVERLLRLPSLVEHYGRLSTGIHASRLRLYPDQFLRIFLPIPPRKDQDQIAAFLLETATKSKKAVARYEREIELLQEYRTRLISDVVTGKVRVS